jgi:hypothetical protein
MNNYTTTASLPQGDLWKQQGVIKERGCLQSLQLCLHKPNNKTSQNKSLFIMEVLKKIRTHNTVNKVNKFITVFALAQSHLPGPLPGGQTRTATLLFIK